MQAAIAGSLILVKKRMAGSGNALKEFQNSVQRMEDSPPRGRTKKAHLRTGLERHVQRIIDPKRLVAIGAFPRP